MAVVLAASCSGDVTPPPPPPIKLATIIIDGGPRAVEHGTVFTVTATARDTAGKVVSTPFVFRSSADSIVSVGPDGKMTARDTGSAFVTASALGVSSAPTEFRVVWFGPASVARVQFNPPNAVTPGAQLSDSIRVVVKNLQGNPLGGAKVAFAVSQGGGSVSPAAPALVTTGADGIAAAKWTLGPTAGKNVATATVVSLSDSMPLSLTTDNPVKFTVTSYAALTILQGDNQTGNVLAPLPVAPSVRLVDSLGKPRAGIPITFSPTANGRVANAVVPTSADGVASPGVWTLGDASGDQQLVVTVEAAKVVIHATATGSTVNLSATQVATSQNATCVTTSDQFASCFGQAPQIGTGDTTKNQSTPTLTKGGVHFTTLVGTSAGAHFCGTSTDLSIYCWGVNAFVDTTGATITTVAPTRLQSNIAWVQVSPGGQHNCALANDRTAYCWGIDTTGQLGDNATTRRFAPTPVSGGFKFAAISAGGSHTCAVTTDGAAFCWGLNSSGQLGDGTFATRTAPTAVSGVVRWKAIGAGSSWTCGLEQNGTAYCWGAGTGKNVPTSYLNAPLFTSLSVGAGHACALTADGTAYCWGDNSVGQLGDSTTTSRSTPTEVVTTMRFASISAGFQHTCGITTDGLVACWGRNQVGELGVSTPLVQTTPRNIVLGVKP